MSDVYQLIDTADAEVRSGPHGWIQWKGTNVCMDVRCSCGNLGHIDADFAYRVRCGKCGALYAVSPHVRLVPVTEEQSAGMCEPIVTDVDEDP